MPAVKNSQLLGPAAIAHQTKLAFWQLAGQASLFSLPVCLRMLRRCCDVFTHELDHFATQST
jgi:hypothetical protein